MKRVCIIGAGSPFGTNTAGYLLARGYDVMGIGRSPKKPECFSLGYDYPYYAYHVTYELEYILEKIEKFKPDCIINYAAQGEGAASWGRDSWRFYETNAVGLVRLACELNERRNFGRFIQIGTSELYGSRFEAATEEAPVTPTSPYGISKAAFDMHLLAMWKNLNFPAVIIRPSNAYSCGQQLHRVIPQAFICGKTGRKLKLHGGGVAAKSYIYGDDLSSAIELSFKANLGEVFNVSADSPTAIKDVVRMCAEEMQIPFDQLCEVAPERFGQDPQYFMNSQKIKRELGWSQKVNWQEGLKRVHEWVNKYPEILTMDSKFRMRA